MESGPVYFRWRFERGTPVVEWVGPGLGTLLGVESADLAALWEGLHRDDQPRVRWRMEEASRTGASWSGTLRWIDGGGSIRWIEVVAAPEARTDGTVAWHGFARSTSDVSGGAEAFGRVDALTGLANRPELSRALGTVLESGRRPTALLFLDLDRFKEVNDQLGHVVGDEVLRVAAGRLRGCVRDRDRIARYGGDEFAVILHPSPGRAAAMACAGRLLNALSEPMTIRGRAVGLSASIGVALAPEDAAGVDALVDLADRRMYAAKAAGGGRIVGEGLSRGG